MKPGPFLLLALLAGVSFNLSIATSHADVATNTAPAGTNKILVRLTDVTSTWTVTPIRIATFVPVTIVYPSFGGGGGRRVPKSDTNYINSAGERVVIRDNWESIEKKAGEPFSIALGHWHVLDAHEQTLLNAIESCINWDYKKGSPLKLDLLLSVPAAAAHNRSTFDEPNFSDWVIESVDIHVEPKPAKPNEEIVRELNADFDKALHSSGEDYLKYERQLLDGKEPETTTMLSRRLRDPDPMASLAAQAFLDGKNQWPKDYQEASSYLYTLPARPQGSTDTDTNPLLLARSLGAYWSDHVANFLAVKLAIDSKERQADLSPKWLKQALILYLQHQKIPSTTAGLIRFAVETDDPELRDSAIDAIKSIPDRELPGKIEAERRRAQTQGKKFPAALEVLQHAVSK